MKNVKHKAIYKDEDLQCLLSRVGDKWTILIMGLLEDSTKRFGFLKREIGGISQKMLTQTLRELERNGIVNRKVVAVKAGSPLHVEYSLTPLGKTLCEPLTALKEWTIKNRKEVIAARAAYKTLRPEKSLK